MFIHQRLLLHGLGLAMALVFPCGDIHEMFVVAEGLAVLGLMLGAEMSTARLLSVQGVGNDELCQFEIVLQTTSLL